MNFDKFMDVLMLDQAKKKVSQIKQEETPQRKYAKLYREKSNNRIVYVIPQVKK